MVLSKLAGGLAGATAVAFLVLTTGCYQADNSPQRVVKQFIRSIGERNEQALDTLLAWDEVAINQYYVGRDYFNRLTKQEQREVVDSFRELFYKDYFPAASAASYTVEEVYVARDISNAIVVFESPSRQRAAGEKTPKKRFTLKMKLYPDRSKWYIVDLNEFVQLNILRGDYDPRKFYLPEPIP